MYASIMPIESKRPTHPDCPVDDIPSLMDGCRAPNLGVHVWSQEGFNIAKESRQERWAVKRNGRYYCGPQVRLTVRWASVATLRDPLQITQEIGRLRLVQRDRMQIPLRRGHALVSETLLDHVQFRPALPHECGHGVAKKMRVNTLYL